MTFLDPYELFLVPLATADLDDVHAGRVEPEFDYADFEARR